MLDTYPNNSYIRNVHLCISRLYDSLPFEFIVNNDCMIFKTDNINTFFGESMTYRFALMKITKNFGDVYLGFIKNTSSYIDKAKVTL